MTLSYSAAHERRIDRQSLAAVHDPRPAILSWGVVIGVVTYLALGPGLYVRFGILHLIGPSTILGYPFLRFRWLNLVLGVLVILAGAGVPGLERTLSCWNGLRLRRAVGVNYALPLSLVWPGAYWHFPGQLALRGRWIAFIARLVAQFDHKRCFVCLGRTLC